MSSIDRNEAPAMGERRARLGYGAQDRLAAALLLDALKSSSFRAVRLADLEGGQVDDFVLVWDKEVWGNSVKWTGTEGVLSWADLCGSTEPLIPQLAQGWKTLQKRWPGHTVHVYLRTNRPASNSTHGNQVVPGVSLDQFLSVSWAALRRGEPSPTPPLEAAWEILRKSSGLDAKEFQDFAHHCHILVGLAAPQAFTYPDSALSHDARAWEREFNRLRQVINDWVESNPEDAEISAQELLRLLGVRREISLLQQFPEPEIGYEENENSARALRVALSNHSSGYLALIGPAGAGKSTLVSKVIQDEPFGIAYFAYLPGGAADPRNRGDALAFYRYLIAVLDQWEPEVRAATNVIDLAQAKEAFALHMRQVKERYEKTGRKTLVLLDGLDHVVREEGLERPLQRELPLPEELPDGCLLLIGTQPQALNALREPIRTQLEAPHRLIEVEPLAPEAIWRALSPARVGRELSESNQQAIVDSCGGNPLFLTYLVRSIQASPDQEAAKIIAEFGVYSGDSDAYYAERLRPLLDNPDWKRILALLCRVRGRVPLEWLQSWPDWDRFEHLHRFFLAAFFRLEEERLSALHNSLISYLRRATRPLQSPQLAENAEKRWHRQLAELYPGGACADELARERLYHLVVAGEHQAVLSIATMEWFRAGAVALVPLDDLKDLVWTCLHSAIALENYAALLHLIAAAREVEQRTFVLENAELARCFWRLGQGERALEYVLNGPQLRVEPEAALDFCGVLAADGQENQSVIRKARQLFDLAKPVRLLYASGSISVHGSDGLKLIEAWACAAPHFVSVPHIIETIHNLNFEESRRDNPDERPSLLRAYLLNKALQTVLERDLADPEALIAAIDATGESGWLFQARLELLENAQRRGRDEEEPLERLRLVREFARVREDSRLRVVECLWRAKRRDEARELLQTLELPTPSPYPENSGPLGSRLGGVDNRVQVAKLRAILELPPLKILPDPKLDYEGADRIAMVCQEIGELWGEATLGRPLQDLEKRFERFLTFHRRALGRGNPERYSHWAGVARTTIYELLLDLAADLKDEGAQALRHAVFTVDQRLGSPVFLPRHRRTLAVGLQRLGAMTVTEALEWVRRSTADANVEDTSERTEACFDIVQTFHELGDLASERFWLETTGRAAHGIGGHKDYQMVSWMEWLDKSLPRDSDSVFLPVVGVAVRTLEVAGGDGTGRACVKLIELCFCRHPLVGVKLGLEMVERGLLQLSDVLQAVIGAAAMMKSESRLLAALYERLYSLIEPRPNSEVAASIVRHASDASLAQEVARRCIAAVKVNMPSDRRRSTIRATVDALQERGLDAPDLEASLPPDADEGANSSSGDLYRMPDGTSRSVVGVSLLLSDPTRQEQWNPNPDDNRYFSWDKALERVSLSSLGHLEALEQAVTQGKDAGRGTNVLVALSRAAARFGDLACARRLAERAYQEAHDGGWVYWLDGGYKRKSLEALVELDFERWLPVARREFSDELLSRRIGSQFLVQDVGEIFDLVRWVWPQNETLQTLNTYFEGLTTEVNLPPDYESLLALEEVWTTDEALNYLLVEQFVHPVVEVAAASRAAVSDGIVAGNRAALRAFGRLEAHQTLEIERALIALHVASRQNAMSLTPFRGFVDAAQQSESAAVQSVAYRICGEVTWPITTLDPKELAGIYALALPADPTDFQLLLRAGAVELPRASFGIALELYRPLLNLVAKQAGISASNVIARAQKIYEEIEKTHTWTKNGDAKLNRWKNGLPVLHYVQPRATVARDATMRVVGELIRADRLDKSFFAGYDSLAPIYDSVLDNAKPVERPAGIEGITIDWVGARWPQWVNALDKAELQNRATHIEDRIVLAERSTFSVPDWETPQEKRSVTLVPGAPSFLRIVQPAELFGLQVNQTCAAYEAYDDEEEDLVFRNRPDENTTCAADWLALNPAMGDALGWELGGSGLFRWVNENGQTMVESLWWRDGWTRLKPPLSFKTLGEGWLVLCAPEAFHSIQQLVGPSRFIVRGKRSCQAKKGSGLDESTVTIEMSS